MGAREQTETLLALLDRIGVVRCCIVGHGIDPYGLQLGGAFLRQIFQNFQGF